MKRFRTKILPRASSPSTGGRIWGDLVMMVPVRLSPEVCSVIRYAAMGRWVEYHKHQTHTRACAHVHTICLGAICRQRKKQETHETINCQSNVRMKDTLTRMLSVCVQLNFHDQNGTMKTHVLATALSKAKVVESCLQCILLFLNLILFTITFNCQFFPIVFLTMPLNSL